MLFLPQLIQLAEPTGGAMGKSRSGCRAYRQEGSHKQWERAHNQRQGGKEPNNGVKGGRDP